MKNIIFIFVIIIVVMAPLSLVLEVQKNNPLNMRAFGGYYQHIVLNERQLDQDVLILGDSTMSSHILANRLSPLRAFNLASWGGSTPVEFFYQLQTYLKKNSAPKCLLLGFVYSSTLYREYGFWKYNVRFGTYNDFEKFIELYDISKEIGGYPSTHYSWIEYVTAYVLSRINYLPWYDGFQKDLHLSFLPRPTNLTIEYRDSFSGSFPLFKAPQKNLQPIWFNSDLQDQFAPDKLFDFYLRKILALTKSHNIHPYFLYSPISEGLHNPKAERHILELVSHISTIEFESHSYTVLRPEMTMKREYFYDTRHLNKKGAEIYTDKVNELIRCSQ